MAAQFDDDPAPCLELARLYYLKNAFRKAQAILQTAYDRAPHDVRVKESRALAFVISAQKNLPKEKWHLVDRDLDRAAACLAAARAAFEQNDYQAACGLACQSLALKRSGEAESLYRYAGFLAGRRRILACL